MNEHYSLPNRSLRRHCPDPLQTLEPVTGPNGPALKNEMMLPHVLDPWACARSV